MHIRIRMQKYRCFAELKLPDKGVSKQSDFPTLSMYKCSQNYVQVPNMANKRLGRNNT